MRSNSFAPCIAPQAPINSSPIRRPAGRHYSAGTRRHAQMKRIVMALFVGVATASVAATALAHEGPMPYGIRHLDHVFLIMMENHGYAEIINNPYMPFTNQLASSAGLATNYFAVAHPSLTNYLEIVGGSNFGVLND